MARAQFNATSFLIRGLVALILVLATFNPTQYSFLHWIAGAGSPAGFTTDHMPYKVLFATVMAVGLSWSHIRRRVSGQVDADDVDE